MRGQAVQEPEEYCWLRGKDGVIHISEIETDGLTLCAEIVDGPPVSPEFADSLCHECAQEWHYQYKRKEWTRPFPKIDAEEDGVIYLSGKAFRRARPEDPDSICYRVRDLENRETFIVELKGE